MSILAEQTGGNVSHFNYIFFLKKKLNLIKAELMLLENGKTCLEKKEVIDMGF